MTSLVGVAELDNPRKGIEVSDQNRARPAGRQRIRQNCLSLQSQYLDSQGLQFAFPWSQQPSRLRRSGLEVERRRKPLPGRVTPSSSVPSVSSGRSYIQHPPPAP